MDSNGNLLIDQLRQAIRDCGLDERQLAETTGVPHIYIVHFMIGRDIELQEASKIAAFLGLELSSKPNALVPSG